MPGRALGLVVLVASILPAVLAVKLLGDSWFWPLGAYVGAYALLVVSVHLLPARPVWIKTIVCLASVTVIIWQGAQLFGEAGEWWWVHLIGIAYPALASVSVLSLPPHGSLLTLLAKRRGPP